jgi:hypothetical protein
LSNKNKIQPFIYIVDDENTLTAAQMAFTKPNLDAQNEACEKLMKMCRWHSFRVAYRLL